MNKTISLSLAKEIAEAAEEKGVTLPKSENVWGCDGHHWCGDEEIKEGNYRIAERGFFSRFPEKEIAPAYDCAELGEMLGRFVQKSTLEFHTVAMDLAVDIGWTETADSEIEARGKMYLYLLKNGYIK